MLSQTFNKDLNPPGMHKKISLIQEMNKCFVDNKIRKKKFQIRPLGALLLESWKKRQTFFIFGICK